MNALPSSLYTAAFALCLFSAGILSERKSRAGYPLAYFVGFLALEGGAFVLELLMAHPATPLKSLWLTLRMCVALLVAPCLWLAMREIVEGVRPRVSSLGGFQVALIALGMLLTLPLLTTAHFGVEFRNLERAPSALRSLIVHGGMLGCIFIFAVQAPLYLWQCHRLLARRATTTAAGRPRRWLHLPLLIVLTTWVFGLLRTLQCAAVPSQQTLAVLMTTIEVGITVAAVYQTLSRIDELETPAEPEPVAVALNSDSTTAQQEPRSEAKYSKSILDPRVRDRIRRKLEAAMDSQALYRDSLLNLRSLSSAIKERTHSVSQVINQDLDSTFYDLVNRHRIQEAQKRLITSPNETVLEIALTVGFNSKSTFNSAFRKLTGMTPSEFRQAKSGPETPQP